MKRIFFFHGPDEQVIREAVADRFGLPQQGPSDDPAFEILDAGELPLQEISAAILTPPLFAPQKKVWVRNPAFLEKVQSKSDADFLTSLEKVIPENNTVIFSSLKPDQRLKTVSVLKKIAETQDCEATPAWFQSKAARVLKAFGKRLDPDAFEYLYGVDSQSPGCFIKDLEAVATYVGPSKSCIELKDATAVVPGVKEEPFFRFVELLTAGRPADSLKMLRSLLTQGESGMGLMSHYVNTLRLLSQARAFGEEGVVDLERIPGNYSAGWIARVLSSVPEEIFSGVPQALNLTKQHPFRAYSILKQSAGFSSEDLERLFLAATQAYWDLVSSRPVDMVLERMVLEAADNNPRFSHT